MRQRALIGRQRSMITLDYFRPFAALLLELERRLKEVDVEPCRRIKAAYHARRFETVEAAVAHQATHNGTILLLDERLIVLLVGTRACHLELLLAAPWHDAVVHEGALFVKAPAAQEPGKQTLWGVDRFDDSKPSRVTNGRHSVQPVATSTI